MPVTTVKEIDDWVREAQTLLEGHTHDTLTVNYGKKYAKIILVRSSYGGHSCWGFIDLFNGDVLKSDSWTRPAKHARGNIFTDKPADCCEWTGPRYLR